MVNIVVQISLSLLAGGWIARVWKFHVFSITQILCEINFGAFTRAKSFILTHLEVLIFVFMTF